MCCGQKRSELRNAQAHKTVRTIPQYASGNSHAQTVRTQLSASPAIQTIPPQPLINTQIRNEQPQAPTPISIPHASIRVRYLENSPIRVRGLVSGMRYEFSGSRPVQQVDPRDVSSLLNTRFFRRA
jgi:hypothetical protein